MLLCACAGTPSARRADANEAYEAANLTVCPAFDTGPSWWTDPDKECPVWSQALPIARQMAGCSEDYVGDPANKCQTVIRRCSPGCDVCRNLKPGAGPDAIFGLTRQPRIGTCYASTWGPGFFGGYDTTFDRRFACSSAFQLARVMVHEATHACLAAGGPRELYDSYDTFRRGTPGCLSDAVAPVDGDEQCGDSL